MIKTLLILGIVLVLFIILLDLLITYTKTDKCDFIKHHKQNTKKWNEWYEEEYGIYENEE